MKKGVVALLLALCITVPVHAKELIKGRATVYTLNGTTKMGTDTCYGVCATGNKDLLGKYVILYQRLPDNSKGDVIGIYRVEDTGCKKEVIDIWCPNDMYKDMIINKTYENGCSGKIWIDVIGGIE